jgi:cadmium resistance protein CadD (predicted permease)
VTGVQTCALPIYVDYLTRFDKFVFGSTLLVFLALIEAVITGSLSFKKNEELSNSIDRYSRFIFPGVFIVILVYSLFM